MDRPRRRLAAGALASTLALGALAPAYADGSRRQTHPDDAALRTVPRSTVTGKPRPSVATPDVTGPVRGGIPESPAAYDGLDKATIAAAGYREQEFFLSGMASAFRFTRTPRVDGHWKAAVAPGSAAAYRTRIVVLTPRDHRRFSGTVVTEWNNVTGGYDAQPDLKFAHDAMFRRGDAYVGVSAQLVGVEAGRRNAPQRYSSLTHPGDSYSYDIYSQAGMAVWRNPRVLDGLRPRVQVADGESQSAGRLEVYVNAVAPLANVYDGYLVHSRGGSTFALQQPPGKATVVTASGPVQVDDGNVGRSQDVGPAYAKSRTDLVTPVLYAMTESDVYAAPDGALDYAPATQPNSRGFRLWEIAGAAHVDDYVGFVSRGDTGGVRAARTAFEAMLHPRSSSDQPGVFSFDCDSPINTGQHAYVLSAALRQLERWVRTGGARGGVPAAAPPLFAGQHPGVGTGSTARRDARGTIRGGVRSPAVDVPVAALSGRANTPGFGCALVGTTRTFGADELRSLYADRHAFDRAWARSAHRLHRAGYLTYGDSRRLVAAARTAEIPGLD